MKKILKILSVLFSVMLLFCAVGCEQSDSDERRIYYYTLPNVAVDETFEITVEEKSYFHWDKVVVCNREGLEFVKYERIPTTMDPDICGAGVYCVYTLRASEAGDYVIKFNYRPFGSDPPVQTNIYKIKITNNA